MPDGGEVEHVGTRRGAFLMVVQSQANTIQMIAEKTSKPAITQHQHAGGTFFRKAAEEGFFGNQQAPSFFSAAIQPKLSVSQPDDPQEREADAVADRVMRMPDPATAAGSIQRQDDSGYEVLLRRPDTAASLVVAPKDDAQHMLRKTQEENEEETATLQPAIMRKCAGCEQEDRAQAKLMRVSDDMQKDDNLVGGITRLESGSNHLHPKSHAPPVRSFIQRSGRAPPAPDHTFESALQGSKGGGTVLPDDTRQSMESRFGSDFSGVRIHTGSRAESLSDGIQAQAFTHGGDIYFNSGKFSPGTAEGSHLLAHELTHTIQQGAGKGHTIHRKTTLSGHSGSFPYHSLNKANARHIRNRAGQNNIPIGLPVAIPLKRTGPDKKQADIVKPAGNKERPKKVKNNENNLIKNNRVDGNIEGVPVAAQSPKTPKKDPAFQKAKKAIAHESLKQQKHHAPAATKRTEAEDAAALPPNEQISQDAKEKNTATIEQVAQEQERPEKRFSADSFKESFKALINAKKPKTEEAAKEMAKKPPVENIAQNFSDGVAKEQSAVTGPLAQKAIPNPTDGVAQKSIVNLPKPAQPPVPKPVTPGLVIPKAKTDDEISAQKESDRVDGAMSKNKLSDDQLTESREPSFIETYQVKEAAKQKAAEAPAEYRKKEEGILATAEAQAGATTATRLNGLMNKNKKSGGDVLTTQGTTETKTEKRQREIKEAIDGIYNMTVIQVKFILQTMTDKVKNDFTTSLKEKTDIFNENLRRRISDYYGDWRIDDKLFGPDPVVVNDNGTTRSLTSKELHDILLEGKEIDTINPDVYEIFVSEKDIFTQAMDKELDGIALSVEQGLTNAHNAIVAGQALIMAFKSTLKGNELEYANQLEEDVKIKFQNLETSIDEAKEDLLNTLADEYRDNLKAMEKSFKDINDELKKSWIDRAIEFIETVAKTIYQLVDLIVSILVRLAGIIWNIIKHPIRFFETLVKGLVEGIGDFIENIGTYLQDSFWTWITGAVPGGAVKLTMGSGVEGMFKLVLNVLQLGPDDLKKVAEKVFGKEFMAMIDKVMETINKGIDIGAKIIEPVIILFTQGPAALWQYIKEHVQEFIQSAFDRMKETVFFAFVEKGIKYLASFFIPGGGFVKIVKAILTAFQFVADNLENIRQFFDAIFDSMEEAIAGNTTGVKNKIVMGLKMGVVMALDFLAKLLGLDKIIDSVHKIIQSIRTAILKAVEAILVKLKPYVLAIVQKVKDLYQKGKAAVVGAGRKVLGWLGLKKEFKDNNGGNHEIYFKGNEQSATLYVASYNPRTVHTLLTAVSKIINKPENNAHADKYDSSVKLHGEIETIKGRLANKTNPNADQDNADMNHKLEELATKLPPLMTMVGGTEPPPLVKPGFANGPKASNFEVAYLKAGRTGGGSTADTNSGATLIGWPRLSTSGLTARSAWVKMHLLTEQLGGPALDANLTPARGTDTNLVAYREVEQYAISAVEAGNTIWYKVTIGYHPAPNADYANHIKIEFGPYDFNKDTNQWERKVSGTAINKKPVGTAFFEQHPAPPDFSGATAVPNINDPLIGRRRIQSLTTGLDRPFAEFVVEARATHGPFTQANLAAALNAAYHARTWAIENFSTQVTRFTSVAGTAFTF